MSQTSAAAAEGRWKWPQSLQPPTAAAEKKVAGSGRGRSKRPRRQLKVAGSGAVDPDVSDYNGRSLEVAVVVPVVPGGSGRSLEVVAVVPNVPGGS